MTTAEVMTTTDVARRFYALAQQGKWNLIVDELYSEDVKSIEPPHAQGLKSVTGKSQLKEKANEWESMIEQTHGGYCNEPQVAGNYFTCTMGADITMKGKDRALIEEVAVYEVKDGKIISEQFFY